MIDDSIIDNETESSDLCYGIRFYYKEEPWLPPYTLHIGDNEPILLHTKEEILALSDVLRRIDNRIRYKP